MLSQCYAKGHYCENRTVPNLECRKIPEGLLIRHENRCLPNSEKKSEKNVSIFFLSGKCQCAEKPIKKPFNFAKRFFHAQNFESEGGTFLPNENCFEKIAQTRKNRRFFPKLLRIM